MASALNATFSITERYLTSSDGAQVFAQAVGNPALPTIVFVHGFALSALVWANIFANTKLLRYFHLVAYDLRGFGRSGRPETIAEYSSRLYADDFMTVMTAFNVSKPIYVGWSMGGSFAADITRYYGPDALSAIVFTASLPWQDVASRVLTDYVQNTVLSGVTNLDNSTLALSSRIDFTNQLFNHPEKVPAEVMWSWLGSTFLQAPARTTYVLQRTQDTTNLFMAGANGLPLLLINGGADRFIVGQEVVNAVKGRFRDLTVYAAPNGSHVFFYEEEEKYVEQLLKFARRVTRRRA